MYYLLITVHICSKQVHYPANPLQPGPVYFLTPRKCAIFGVCCEAIPRQVHIGSQNNKTYMIDDFTFTVGQLPHR